MSETGIVFDTEPLIAYIRNEPGANEVKEHLDRVSDGTVDGFVSPVTLTEVHYIPRRFNPKHDPDDFITDLQAYGVDQVKASSCWREAARYKHEYQIALGDAYSLAAAKYVGAKLLVGADDDFDDITDVEVVRFRDDAA